MPKKKILHKPTWIFFVNANVTFYTSLQNNISPPTEYAFWENSVNACSLKFLRVDCQIVQAEDEM